MRIPKTTASRLLRSSARVLGLLLSLSALPVLAADWPTRPVTIVVPAGAGGGSDGTARILSKYLKDAFGEQFNVLNLGQGGGVVGINRIVGAEPDGYTLGVLFNYAHYKEMGQADFEVDDFTPLAQYNFDPAGFQVRDDSPFTTVNQALDAIKADPAKYTIACAGGCGGSWPVAVATLLDRWGVDMGKVRMIPGQGAAAAMQDLAAGGVDFVPCSLPEAEALLKTGTVRSLAVFGPERQENYPEVPSLKEATGLEMELGSFRGLVAPAGLPADVRGKLEDAMKKVYADPQWQAEMKARGFGTQWRDSAEFERYLQQHTSDVKALFAKMGV